MNQLIRAIKAEFRRTRPDWLPPHAAVAAVGRRKKLPTKINGKPGRYWSAARLSRMIDNFRYTTSLEKLRVTMGDHSFRLEWSGWGRVKVKP